MPHCAGVGERPSNWLSLRQRSSICRIIHKHALGLAYMNENKNHNTIGLDGLIEFGQYLTTLADTSCHHYTFEIPNSENRLRERSLDEVLKYFQEFCGRKVDTFRVSICYFDYQQGAMGRSDRTFTRQNIKQAT